MLLLHKGDFMNVYTGNNTQRNLTNSTVGIMSLKETFERQK